MMDLQKQSREVRRQAFQLMADVGAVTTAETFRRLKR